MKSPQGKKTNSHRHLPCFNSKTKKYCGTRNETCNVFTQQDKTILFKDNKSQLLDIHDGHHTQHFTHLIFPGVKKMLQPHSLPTATGLAEAKAKHHRLNLPEIPIESLPRDIQLLHPPSKPSNPTGVRREPVPTVVLQLGYTNEDRIRNDHQRKEGFKLPSFYLFQKKNAGDIPGILMQKQANWKKTMCVSFCAIQRTRAAYVNSLCLY